MHEALTFHNKSISCNISPSRKGHLHVVRVLRVLVILGAVCWGQQPLEGSPEAKGSQSKSDSYTRMTI